MGIAEQYEQMEGWNRILVAAGFVCDGRPAKVYELATLILQDNEVNKLVTDYTASKPLPQDVFSDNPAPREPFETNLIAVLEAMTLEQREALQARVVMLWQQKKAMDL
jgi:hypothetical protein